MGTHIRTKNMAYENIYWTVIWHVEDHAEYETFEDEDDAWDKYQSLDGGYWATRIHTPEGRLEAEYGDMHEEDWELLDQVVEEVVRGTRPAIACPDGAAVRVGWKRGVSARDVRRVLGELREMWPDTQIVIGSGVHGGRDQRNWDDRCGTRLHTFIPRTCVVQERLGIEGGLREQLFFDQDEAHVIKNQLENVLVLNLVEPDDAEQFRDAARDPQNICVFGMCFGVDNKRWDPHHHRPDNITTIRPYYD